MNWFHLTYASADAGPGRSGGWDVQQVTPGTPPPIEAQMRSGVSTRLETLDRLDEFPTTPELAGRTRRLAFRYDDDGGSVWWHAVEAGKDATGRPGNVFTHAAAMVGLPDTLRPIDLWRSPSWLTPFGQTEVAAAALPTSIADGVLDRSAAIERAFARQVETESLLAAVASCLDKGWSLILASESQDEFAAWLSVVSHMTAARVAAGTLAFSTFERATKLPQALEQVRIVGIPAADLRRAQDSSSTPTAQRMLILDLDDLPTTAPHGEWAYAGQRWPSGSLWQEAFYELTDAGRYPKETVRAVLARMDELAADADDYSDPGAPLAAALVATCRDNKSRSRLLGQWAEKLGIGVQAMGKLLGLADQPSSSPRSQSQEDVTQAPTPAAHTSPTITVEAAARPALPSSSDGYPDVELALTVTLPPPEKAASHHFRVAYFLLDNAGVLTGQRDVSRVERWMSEYHDLNRIGQANIPALQQGGQHGPDA